MSIEAMKQALEALRDPLSPTKRVNAITYLRQAIAEAEKQEPATKEQIREAIVFNLPLYTHPQPKVEQEPDEEVLGFNGWGFPIEHSWACKTCKDKLCVGDGSKDDPIRSCPSCNPKAQPKVEQEPVASEAYDMIDRFLRNSLHDEGYADYSAALDILYTHPQPKRKPLTVDGVVAALFEHPLLKGIAAVDRYEVMQLVRIVEAAHGIKGEA